jgi:hypothetical protein
MSIKTRLQLEAEIERLKREVRHAELATAEALERLAEAQQRESHAKNAADKERAVAALASRRERASIEAAQEAQRRIGELEVRLVEAGKFNPVEEALLQATAMLIRRAGTQA